MMRYPFAAIAAVTLSLACSGSDDPTGTPSPQPDAGMDSGGEPDAVGPDADSDADIDAGLGAEVELRVHYPEAASLITEVVGIEHSLSEVKRDASGGKNTVVFRFRLPPSEQEVPVNLLHDQHGVERGPHLVLSPGSDLDVYPWYLQSEGRVEKILSAHPSAALGNSRDVWAYLPPSYPENTEIAYPVAYMFDGNNLFDAARSITGVEWQVDETLDRELPLGSIGDLIVIAPDRGANRIAEYSPVPDSGYPGSGLGPSTLTMFSDELKPLIDSTYPTDPAVDKTIVMGSSLGGLMSLFFGIQRPDLYGRLGVMSPSLQWAGGWAFDALLKASPKSWSRIYVDWGSNEGLGLNATSLIDVLAGLGYQSDRLMYFEEPGGDHNEMAWARRLPGALGFLLPGPNAP